MSKLHHQHLLVKAYVNNPPLNEIDMDDWMERLVKAIGMKVVIAPRTVYVRTEGNRGLTSQIGLETSHAAIHVWDDVTPAMLQMDVYSCKCFDNQIVIDMINEFGLIAFESMTIDRNDNFIVQECRKWINLP
jgi:S-adenosylmethionine/arginine decarboxylase-like enzyme